MDCISISVRNTHRKGSFDVRFQRCLPMTASPVARSCCSTRVLLGVCDRGLLKLLRMAGKPGRRKEGIEGFRHTFEVIVLHDFTSFS